MRFLVDQAVSWQIARDLKAAGHDAVHVRDIGLAAANDESVLQRAVEERRVVITQDTDFGTLLTTTGARRPSVILLRLRDGRPEVYTRALLESLRATQEDLQQGVIVVVGDAAIRIRRLSGI